ncbi:uncharacterized protein BDV14DRAFT_201463 [Aspergillus stella-maris]|uniref:uncharacterized protein n=1 Tax=Aspergillus stella-maris TaxID=1810926 RepID=UPI003CCD2062
MSDSDDQSGKLQAVVASFLALTNITMILRCYARGFVVKASGWDDGLMIIANLGVLFSRENTPGRSSPRAIIRSFRRPDRLRGTHDLSYPLLTFDETIASRLRPDKLSITVTQVTTQHCSDVGLGAGEANTSAEQFTPEPQYDGLGCSGELVPGIYRSTELSQTLDAESTAVTGQRA